MTMFVDESINKNCWNMRDSFGEICIFCGCCSKDKERRYSSRIWVLNEWIDEDTEFLNHIDYEYQRENVQRSVDRHMRMLRYYERKLKELKEHG